MYGGYNINELMIYNSGSLVNYINNKKLIPYWKDPSANKMIRNAIEKNKHVFFQKFEKLINQGYLNTRIKLEMSFYELSLSPHLWSLLITARYLTIIETIDEINRYSRVKIPNDEILKEFRKLL